MSNVLVIGGSGYLGRHLVELAPSDWNIWVTGRKALNRPNYIVLDFDNPDTFKNIKDLSLDYLFILGADLSGLGTTALSYDLLKTNVVQYALFLNYIKNMAVSKGLIYISSMTVYSASNEAPVSEESCTLFPPNTYGLSKKFGEQLTAYHCNNYDLGGLCLRLPGLFGGDRMSGFIYNAIKKITNGADLEISTDGLIYWESASVVDISKMIIDITNNYSFNRPFEIYNLGYGEDMDIVKAAHLIGDKIKSKSAIVEVSERGFKEFYLDNSKAKSEIKIEYTFSKAIDKYMANISL